MAEDSEAHASSEADTDASSQEGGASDDSTAADPQPDVADADADADADESPAEASADEGEPADTETVTSPADVDDADDLDLLPEADGVTDATDLTDGEAEEGATSAPDSEFDPADGATDPIAAADAETDVYDDVDYGPDDYDGADYGPDDYDASEYDPAVDPDPVAAADATLDEDDEFISGPESDQEMPLADHIEEMVRRLGVVILVAGIATLIVFPLADDVINYLWNTHIPGVAANPDRRPRLYGPLELILTELKVASLAGVVIGLPLFVYETYLFMRPGLFKRERKYYLAAVPTSLVLALVGVAFAHFIVLPVIFAYFTSYTTGTAVIAFGLRETFNLILILMGYMAVVFQIPLFIMLAIMMGLVTRRWLEEKRLLFWGAFLGLAFIVSPDPTGMAPIIVGATMIVLFEGTLGLLRWTGN